MSATPPNIGPATNPSTASPNTVPSAWPRRSRGALIATHARARRPGRGARHTLDEPGDPERDRPAGERERETGKRQDGEPEQKPALRPDPPDEQAARDAADEGARPVRPEQRAGLELRQVVRVGEVGEERDDRPEQHRVEEHDRAGDGDDAAHRPRIRTARRGRLSSRPALSVEPSVERRPNRVRPDRSDLDQRNAPSRCRLRPANPVDPRRSDCLSGEPSTFGAPCSVHSEI